MAARKAEEKVKKEPTKRAMMLDADEHGIAPDIYAEYENNGVAADRKYKGKTVCVVGESGCGKSGAGARRMK